MALNLSKIEARLTRVPRQFNGQLALFGLPKGANYGNGTPVAYVGAIQEFGAPEVGIPPRSFFRPTVEARKAYWVAILKNFIPKVGAGQFSAVQALDAVGAAAVGDIKDAIAQIQEPALSPVTVLLRKWRKKGRVITGRVVGEAAAAIAAGEDPGNDNKPLNDSGYLLASVHSKVGTDPEDFAI